MAKKKREDDEPQAETSDGAIAANDAWTGLLAISFLALAIGSGFLLYDYLKYSDQEPPRVPEISSKSPQKPPKGDGGKVDDKDKDKGKDKDKDKKEGARLNQPRFNGPTQAIVSHQQSDSISEPLAANRFRREV
jgi:hypothetical protein